MNADPGAGMRLDKSKTAKVVNVPVSDDDPPDVFQAKLAIEMLADASEPSDQIIVAGSDAGATIDQRQFACAFQDESMASKTIGE